LSHYEFRNSAILTCFISIGIATIIGGCSTKQSTTGLLNREVLPSPPNTRIHAPSHEGSLFAGESRGSLLFVDRKARHVNDIITVRIVESASASGEASTATGRDSSISGKLEAVFGLEDSLVKNGINPASVVKGGLTNNFDGSGATTRKNSLSASITAIVRDVFPNGNLYVEGKKDVIINNERQYIIISGIVRPEDIAPDNSITSDLIADSRIEYSGRGVLADKQRPGWLGRIIDITWPF
jgi:flagellar L-ring protein precursor FlgH